MGDRILTDKRGKTIAEETRYDLYVIYTNSETLRDTPCSFARVIPVRTGETIFLEEYLGRGP